MIIKTVVLCSLYMYVIIIVGIVELQWVRVTCNNICTGAKKKKNTQFKLYMFVHERFKRYSVRIPVSTNKVSKKGSSILNLICLLINPCCEHFRSDTKLKKAAVLIQYGLVEIGKPRKRSNTTYPGLPAIG